MNSVCPASASVNRLKQKSTICTICVWNVTTHFTKATLSYKVWSLAPSTGGIKKKTKRKKHMTSWPTNACHNFYEKDISAVWDRGRGLHAFKCVYMLGGTIDNTTVIAFIQFKSVLLLWLHIGNFTFLHYSSWLDTWCSNGWQIKEKRNKDIVLSCPVWKNAQLLCFSTLVTLFLYFVTSLYRVDIQLLAPKSVPIMLA